MSNIHLVTGYAGQEHVTSADQGAFNASIFGNGQFVLNRGNKFAASAVTNNQIRVLDGDILMQGRHIRLNEGTYVDLTIESGTSGYLRNDLIVARYTKNANTGVEECNLVVIKGENAVSNPVDPAYTSGDIIADNVALNDMPLYRVSLNGVNVGEIVPLFTAKDTYLADEKQDKTNKLTTESDLADGDYFPFYDTSATAQKKVLWSRIKTILGALFAPLTHSHAISDVTNLQSTLNGKAASSHNHAASAINSGTLSSDRLPTVPVAKGGTGATTATGALANLGAAASSHNHSAANITSGTLPVVRGGTGVSSLDALRSALVGDWELLSNTSINFSGRAGDPYDGAAVTKDSKQMIAANGVSFKDYKEIKIEVEGFTVTMTDTLNPPSVETKITCSIFPGLIGQAHIGDSNTGTKTKTIDPKSIFIGEVNSDNTTWRGLYVATNGSGMYGTIIPLTSGKNTSEVTVDATITPNRCDPTYSITGTVKIYGKK